MNEIVSIFSDGLHTIKSYNTHLYCRIIPNVPLFSVLVEFLLRNFGPIHRETSLLMDVVFRTRSKGYFYFIDVGNTS